MKPRVAFIHYWLVGMRGGERVLEALAELYPGADIFTHVYDPRAMPETLRSRKVRTTFIQKLPDAIHRYRDYLPLMPLALEQLDLREYDLVISSESGPAKGVLTRPQTLHVCYCHTVMRYLWDLYQEYQEGLGFAKRILMPLGAHYTRLWDYASAARVDEFVANSRNVAERIRKTYRRDAKVIYPPVDVDRFNPNRPRENFYLTVSQLIPYKRVDIIVEAFTRLRLPLVVIGEGGDMERLQATAGDCVKFMGRQTDEVVTDYMERCKAFVFAANEDFGIVPVEAMAAGAPVLAYGHGGVAETVQHERSGLLFEQQTAAALTETLKRFESGAIEFSPEVLRARAEQFSRATFLRQFRTHMDDLWRRHCDGH